MGASDSKLVFKKGIFRLSEERHIPADDTYWTSFWELPETSEDVFSLFAPADVRRTRDNALENLETLILAVTSRLFVLRHHPSFPDPEIAPDSHALNCIRVLTRILPFLYEKESLQAWEENFFWARRRKRTRTSLIANEVLFDESQEVQPRPPEEFEDAKPLAEELIDTLIDLLFFSDLTVPRQPHGSPKTLKYNPATWRVPYNTLVFKDPKQILVTYTLQFLLVVLLYPVPEEPGVLTPKNFYRHFAGRLHRPQDFQFIVDGMTRILHQPLQANASYIPGAQNSVRFAPETIMLFWELTQCNKRFRSFMIDTERAHDFVIFVLFYALEYKGDASKQGVVRMCAFLLQTLSAEKNFGINLNKMFEAQETLPPAIRITGFRGTYADFLIQSIYNLITKSQGKLTVIYPALLAVINNISAYLEGLSGSTCTRLIQLYNSMSSPSFLMANDTNHNLLRSLLESINAIVEHQYKKNPHFIYAIIRNRKRFEALRSFTLESGQEEIERRNRKRKEAAASNDPLETNSTRSSLESLRSPTTSITQVPTLHDVPEDGAFAVGDDDDSDNEQRPTPSPSSHSENPSRASSVEPHADGSGVPRQLRGMSEKARGKMPAGPRFSRQNSTTSLSGYSISGQSQTGAFEPTAEWIDSWLPELPLHTILTLINQLTALLPRQSIATDSPTPAVLQRIQEIQLVGVDASPVRVHMFEWSPMALGWYESLLWGFVFASEMQVARGTVGIWNTTNIKLFHVQQTAAQGPSLTSPRGAVDAVGSNIVSRIGAINLRGAAGPAVPPGGAQAPRRIG
uniref:Uncharacterized protein 100H1.240 n=1 Tax=Neurospora crassa TaxID=5141 RepID=Q871T7_NEUCS|nr:conserved hypothetical protein [Neurospora crassa]